MNKCDLWPKFTKKVTWSEAKIAQKTPECQEGVPSQGGQRREVHHVQVEQYQGHF